MRSPRPEGPFPVPKISSVPASRSRQPDGTWDRMSPATGRRLAAGAHFGPHFHASPSAPWRMEDCFRKLRQKTNTVGVAVAVGLTHAQRPIAMAIPMAAANKEQDLFMRPGCAPAHGRLLPTTRQQDSRSACAARHAACSCQPGDVRSMAVHGDCMQHYLTR